MLLDEAGCEWSELIVSLFFLNRNFNPEIKASTDHPIAKTTIKAMIFVAN
jgi:hypothetical protein